MTFVLPFVLLLLLPLVGGGVLAKSAGQGRFSRLPGAWQQAVASGLRGYIAQQSKLTQTGTPILCFGTAVLVIVALSRPGLDTDSAQEYTTLAGRVIILDVGADLTRHRHFVDDLHHADSQVSTSVIASSGDTYRIIPFTTDKSQIDRYVRVLNANMIPMPGQSPHLALAQAERLLSDAGYIVRQVVLVTARHGPEQVIEIPLGRSDRFVVPLITDEAWTGWAAAQHAAVLNDDAVADLTQSLRQEAVAAARSELPSARTEFTTLLIALAALPWLLMFRRRAA